MEYTVKGMMDLENSRRRNQSSSLQVFCRVDVGVLFQGGAAHYYVNELERSLTVGLFQESNSTVRTMLHSAIERIPAYIENSIVA